MKNILKLFPSPATTLLLFITPLVFTIYFVVTKFSDQFITNQQITYFDVQHSWAGTFFVTQTWLDWFNSGISKNGSFKPSDRRKF